MIAFGRSLTGLGKLLFWLGIVFLFGIPILIWVLGLTGALAVGVGIVVLVVLSFAVGAARRQPPG